MSSTNGGKDLDDEKVGPVVKRVENWESGDVTCPRCRKHFTLYWNGGELGWRDCCGLRFATEHVRTDLVIRELKPTTTT